MRIRLRLYGGLALRFSPCLELEVKEGITIGELLDRLRISSREHHIIVNERKVNENYKPKEGDEIKLLPVVYGGQSPNQ